MHNKKLVNALEKLGLSSLAISVYFLLLENSEYGVSDLCIKTGRYRSKIYQSFDELKKLNLIDRNNDYSREISIKSPNVVYTLLKNKQFEINNSIVELQAELPYILANMSQSSKELSVRVFEGTNKFSYLMTTILDECNEGGEMLSFNENDDLYDVIGSNYFFNVWVEKRIKRNIFNRILVNSQNSFIEKELPLDNKKFRQSKVMNKAAIGKGSFWVIDNKLILWDTVTPKAIVIDSIVISGMMKAVFEREWKEAR